MRENRFTILNAYINELANCSSLIVHYCKSLSIYLCGWCKWTRQFVHHDFKPINNHFRKTSFSNFATFFNNLFAFFVSILVTIFFTKKHEFVKKQKR